MEREVYDETAQLYRESNSRAFRVEEMFDEVTNPVQRLALLDQQAIDQAAIKLTDRPIGLSVAPRIVDYEWQQLTELLAQRGHPRLRKSEDLYSRVGDTLSRRRR